MGSRRTKAALRRRAGIALAVWAVAFSLLAVVSALPEGPAAALIVDDAYPAPGVVVHFDASGSVGHDQGNGRIVAFRFDFGDGQESAWQQSPLEAHAFPEVGNFTATVTVVDLRDLTGTASVTVHVGGTPPPPPDRPDLFPVTLEVTPAEPRVNDSVNLTVTVLNRGGATATGATVDAYDLRPDGSIGFLGSLPLPGPLSPSNAEPVRFPPFVAVQVGNHTLRAVTGNVTPAPASSTPHELRVSVQILAAGTPPGPGTRGGAAFDVGPLAVALSAAAVAAMAGAGYLLLRRPPKGPLEPPPAQPPDRSPPPIWPP